MSQKKKLTKKEIEAGLASGQITYKDPKSKHSKGYEIRIESGFEVSASYPGLQDHPSPEGTVGYVSTVDTSDAATVWEAIKNEQYAQGGIPRWVADSLSCLDISIYWQIAHYQMRWGGKANMSFTTLARNLGVQYRSIQRSVHKLLDIGAIKLIRKNTGRRPAAYQVVLFSSLEQRPFVETTSQDVATTGETRKGDPSVVQKTKPLKGRVVRSPAEAGRATPREKIPTRLLTIDEDRKMRAKSIASKEVADKPKRIRSFFPNEVSNKKIQEVLKIEFLAQKWEAVKEVVKVSGELDLDTETFIAGPLADESTLMKNVQGFLTNKNKFDVMNLAQAVDFTLESFLRSLAPKQKELALQLANHQRQKEREAEIESAKLKAQAELEERERIEEVERFELKRKLHVENFEYLNLARKFLHHIYPDLQDTIDGWGGASSFIYELGSKEKVKFDTLEIRAQMQLLSENIPRKIVELEKNFGQSDLTDRRTLDAYYQRWIDGGDDWEKLAEIPNQELKTTQ